MGLRDGDAPGRYSSEAVSAKVHGDVAGGGSHGSHDCRRDAIGRFLRLCERNVATVLFRARHSNEMNQVGAGEEGAESHGEKIKEEEAAMVDARSERDVDGNALGADRERRESKRRGRDKGRREGRWTN